MRVGGRLSLLTSASRPSISAIKFSCKYSVRISVQVSKPSIVLMPLPSSHRHRSPVYFSSAWIRLIPCSEGHASIKVRGQPNA